MDTFSPDARTSPFPRGYRASGLLLHVTSLPSPYGIGDLGPARSPGWIGSIVRVRHGGRRFRWDPQGTATRHINACHRSPATGC